MIEIDAQNNQEIEIDLEPSIEAVRRILADHGYAQGAISIAVVDDVEMHELNRRYLEHDYPTDVLSFVLEDDAPHLEGEIIVSADTARREAVEWRWDEQDELLLYVIHGSLHLVGYDDHDADERARMRAREMEYMQALGRPIPPGRGVEIAPSKEAEHDA